MEPISDACLGYVVHKNNGFEYAVIYDHVFSMYPRVAWNDGGGIVEVHGSLGHNTTDDLLLMLADKNPAAARWLLQQQVVLDHPKQTIIKMVGDEVIFGKVLQEDNVTVIECEFPEGDEKTLHHYGWHNDGMSRQRFVYQPSQA